MNKITFKILETGFEEVKFCVSEYEEYRFEQDMAAKHNVWGKHNKYVIKCEYDVIN